VSDIFCMDIRKYTSFFHDGGIIDIQSNADNIEILMESSELLPEWNEDNIPLSNTQTIRGKFNHYGLKSIDCLSTESRFRLKSTKDSDTRSVKNQTKSHTSCIVNSP
jgi:hypothetical protein